MIFHLHSPPASGRRVQARAGAGGLSPLSLVCSLLLQSSHALPALFPSLVLTSVVGLRRLLAKIGGSGGGLFPLETRHSVVARVVLAESAFRVNSELFSPLSSSLVFRRRGEAARVLVTAGVSLGRGDSGSCLPQPRVLRSLIRGEVRVGCHRGENVRLCFFVCVLLFDLSGRLWPLDDSQFATPFFCCPLLWRPDLILRQFKRQPDFRGRTFAVKKKFFGSQRLRCLDGSRESLAISESASRPSSHPCTVVLRLLFMVWRRTQPVFLLVSLAAEASSCSTGDVVQGVVWRFLHFGFGLQGLGKYLNPPLWSFELHRQRKLQWRSSRTSYSRDVKGTPGILGNEENLTFPRVTSTVENGYRSRRISKNKLAECVGFSVRAKLGL
ncbi:LOW QUALITY PROTEIN: hypothetical protein HID58_072740 [Brassica napus]|uniref:Uncharacterized protein n=1 Tax=Brassica napus TaxID=3708 RepID=A0ABQ7Z5F8_BRANA|nr:LOW QUALITY PROTEIN: hypothetical protein HID58_072740 [Brassica napus]